MGRTVRIVGAPTDYGADRRGVDMGPSAIRYAGLESHVASAGVECADGGNLEVPIAGRAAEAAVDGHVRFLDETEANGEEKQGGIAIRASRPDLNLVVVRASEPENAAHEAMLEKLRGAGECVWDRLDGPREAAK